MGWDGALADTVIEKGLSDSAGRNVHRIDDRNQCWVIGIVVVGSATAVWSGNRVVFALWWVFGSSRVVLRVAAFAVGCLRSGGQRLYVCSCFTMDLDDTCG